ncbi:MAG: hypothetical protein B6241_01165 [Spirochaetaceae bacterium 4572_59]|nr:MAG: hypothetical protein B6241_01165 [Spirochaetaceae bacterium 4572_59]
MRTFNNILVTGRAGFIGSNFIRVLLNNSEFKGRIINLDKLTYAGNAASLNDVAAAYQDRYIFKQGDIWDADFVAPLFNDYEIDAVCHLAAESHVDRSIEGPEAFIKTNVNGTFTLLDAARKAWADNFEEGLRKTVRWYLENREWIENIQSGEYRGCIGELEACSSNKSEGFMTRAVSGAHDQPELDG